MLKNVKSLKPLNPCYDISTQLFFLLIITECTCKKIITETNEMTET